jgi:DNA-binding CsgD family transcriptional regulator
MAHLGTPRNSTGLVGRDSELATIAAFMGRAGPAALLIAGAAGIGKTTVWRAGIENARQIGRRVLAARPLETETDLAFGGLDALLADVADEFWAELPQPQRTALGIALLREPHGPRALDPRAVGAATVELLRRLAAREPVLIAVDDLHWLDEASLRALRFTVHRLGDSDVLLLLATRSESASVDVGLDRDELDHLELGPLAPDALRELVQAKLGEPLLPPAARWLGRVSGGNPFYALELARSVGIREIVEGRTPPLKPLRSLVGARLDRLSPATVEALGFVAALGHVRRELLEELLDDEQVLDEAFAEGVLEPDGDTFRFAHPLLAETTYAALPPSRQRAVHRRLAALVSDPEERARHLAAGVTRPDSGVSAAVETGAAAARARGAPAAAAELYEAAARLTPPECAAAGVRRRLDAARCHFAAGSVHRGSALCARVAADGEDGDLRGEALAVLGTEGPVSTERSISLCEQAVRECETPGCRARCLLLLADARSATDENAAYNAVREAVSLLDDADDPGLRAWVTAQAGQYTVLSEPSGDGLEQLRHALQLERRHRIVAPHIELSAATGLGFALLVRDELDEARSLLVQQRATAAREGAVVAMGRIAFYLAELECRAGRMDRAREYADEALAVADGGLNEPQLGAALYARAHVAAIEGDVQRARLLAQRGLETSLTSGDHTFPAHNLAVLGFLELSLDEPAEALVHLERAHREFRTLRAGIVEPGTRPEERDRIESLIAVGRRQEAEAALAEWEQLGRELDRPFALATAARARGLLSAARSDFAAAAQSFETALAHHQRLPVPHERARTLLAFGTTLRRVGRRRDARAALEEARATFEQVGSPLWAHRAMAEAGRIGGRAPAGDELTPTERQVADLVAEGRSNREVADALFITVRTVESNLTRVYSKLGLRSRSELAARWRDSAQHG